MKISEMIKIMKQWREREGNSKDDNDTFDYVIKTLETNECVNFKEVVDFFNDIMESLHEDLKLYSISTESVTYARNRVYDIFSRRYRIKEIEINGKSETIQEV